MSEVAFMRGSPNIIQRLLGEGHGTTCIVAHNKVKSNG